MKVVTATAIGSVAQTQTGTALDLIDPSDPITILAPIVAILGALLLAYAPRHIGDDSRLWRAIRSLLPHIDEEAREHGFYTSYEIDTEAETAGVWHGSLESLESALKAEGYRLGPLAAHKETSDGRREVGSWVDVGERVAPQWLEALRLQAHTRQTHVTLFDASDTDDPWLVTGHEEYSAYSALTAYWHLRAKDYDPAAGVTAVRDQLGDRDRFEPADN